MAPQPNRRQLRKLLRRRRAGEATRDSPNLQAIQSECDPPIDVSELVAPEVVPPRPSHLALVPYTLFVQETIVAEAEVPRGA